MKSFMIAAPVPKQTKQTKKQTKKHFTCPDIHLPKKKKVFEKFCISVTNYIRDYFSVRNEIK